MTYSIVARDPETGQLGIAVQSHFFGVGRIVPWAEPGVGAVATQAFAEPSYGPLGLDLMRAGRSAPEALATLVEADPGADVRQVAMVDAAGTVAAHTGARCVAAAGQLAGEQVTAQANMVTRPSCWPAMVDAHASAGGDLGDRLLAALEAAEREGGDVRGRQSAAILIVSGERTERPWEGVLLDVRVDDHPEPVAEIARLARYSGAYDLIGKALFTTGVVTSAEPPSAEAAEEAIEDLAAAEAVLAGNPEAAVWRSVVLARAGRRDEARQRIAELLHAHPQVAEFVRRLPAAGLVPDAADLAPAPPSDDRREP
jgi:uncharacterized Ntn-hydrolase superfamily protein